MTEGNPLVETFCKKTDPKCSYSLHEVLDKGLYGVIYRGKFLSSNKECAIEILPCEIDGRNLLDLENEIHILKTLRSPYVISFQESYMFNNELWIIMEYCAGHSLSDFIEFVKFEEEQIGAIMAYSCLGLFHLHSNKCINRLLKTSNLMLTADGKAKISYVEVSPHLSSPQDRKGKDIDALTSTAQGILNYDTWSLGMILYELSCGHSAKTETGRNRGEKEMEVKQQMIKNELQMVDWMVQEEKHDGNIIVTEKSQNEDEGRNIEEVIDSVRMSTRKWSSDLLDFLSKCFEKNILERLSADDLLKHPFIAEHVRIILEHEKCAYENKYKSDKSESQGLSVLMELVHLNLPTLLIKREKKDWPHHQYQYQHQYQHQEVSIPSSALNKLDIGPSCRVMQSLESASVNSDMSHDLCSGPKSAIATALPILRPPCPVVPRLIGSPFDDFNIHGEGSREDDYCLQISGSYTPPSLIGSFIRHKTVFPDDISEACTNSSSCYSDSRETTGRSSNDRDSSRNPSSRSRSKSPGTGGVTTSMKTSQNHFFKGFENRVLLDCSMNTRSCENINEEIRQSPSSPLLTVLSKNLSLVDTRYIIDIKNMSNRDIGTPSTVTATIHSPLGNIDCCNIGSKQVLERSRDCYNCIGIVDQTLDPGVSDCSRAEEQKNKHHRESLHLASLDQMNQPRSLFNHFSEAATVTDYSALLSRIPKFALEDCQDIFTHPPDDGKYFDLNFSGKQPR